MASLINSDSGAVSGSAGLKSSADSSGVLQLQTNGTTAVTVNASQNVGIGTASPAYKLDIGDSSSGIRIGSDVAGYRFYREPTGGSAGLLQFYGAQSGYTGYIFGGVDGERLRIDSSGNVGVGTSSPSVKFEVLSANVATARISSSQTSPNNILMTGGSSYNYGVIGVNTGNNTSTGDIFQLGYTASAGTAPTSVLQWSSAAKCIGLNTNPATSGTGITFPATQDASSNANTLDDYEEGTWTPVFKGTTGDPTVTYTQQSGRYVKIGRMFYWGVAIRVNTTSGGSGILYIESPVPILSTGSNTWGGTVAWNGTGTFTGQNPTTLAAINGSTSLYLHTNSTTMATSDVTVSQLANGSNIEAFGMFETG